ncbi:MAG: hypothetical protein HY554_13105 [Elusimicrobia bacterium]|nr:hypothetical protein [Elusimicrobiota bacterium]
MKASLEIPPDGSLREPALRFVRACAARLYPESRHQERLDLAVAAALDMVLGNNRDASAGPIGLELGEREGRFEVTIRHRGVPILLGGDGPSQINAHYYPKFLEASRHADRVTIESQWRQGQAVRLELAMGAGAQARRLDALAAADAAVPDDEELSVRALACGEEEALSRLFYFVYGYEYVNETVYFPEQLRAMVESGELLSTVAARPNGRLVGHVGLLRKSLEPPVYEAAMGVVDPAVKSRGLFAGLFKATMERARRTPMRYCLFDFVTNHDLSQRHINRYGTCELALLAGCQSRQTQARLERIGLGPDPEGMDRYSLLVAVILGAPHPFGREVSLPDRVGEGFGFLLEGLGLSWTPAPRFEALSREGRYTTACQSAQSAVFFDLEEPGLAAAERIVAEWRGLLRNGFDYAAVTVPLDRPGLGALYEFLGANGFFAAGFMPYRLGGRLGFRFQALGPTKVAFDRIQVASPRAKRLLGLVRSEYEASCLI